MQTSFGSAISSCVEVLFDPALVGKHCAALPESIHTAISACPVDTRMSLWESLVLTGGTAKITGLRERLEREIARSFPVSEYSSELQVT